MDSNEIESIKSMLSQMLDKQSDMDGMLREMDKTLTQLNNVVVGNPTYGQKGLIVELNDVKEYVQKDKMIKSKILGGLTVIGVLWTIFLQYFMQIIKK